MARDWFFVLLNPRADLRSASPFETEEDKRDDSSDEEEEKNVPTIEDDSDDEEPAAKKAKVEKKKKKKSKGSDDDNDSVNSDVVDDLSGDEVDTSNIIEGGRRSRKGRATSFQYTATDLGEDSDED